MSDVILRHGGTLDKFIGDDVMAFWNAPVAHPMHAQRACEAASEMLAILDKVLASPAEFNTLPQAARRRVLAHHTWAHRVTQILKAIERF